MKNEELQERVQLLENETPLMVFRELVRLSFDILFVAESGNEKKVPRDVLSLLDATFGMEISDMMSLRSTEQTRDMILDNGVLHRHLQDLTTLVLFQLATVGQRQLPYDLMEVVKNFCLIFQPSHNDVKDLSFLNADNKNTVSYYRDEQTMIKMLIANPWMLVLWVMRLDKMHFDTFTSLE